MAKIKKVANGEYIGANKYTIKDAGDGKSTVDFAPDSVLTPGTEVGAELLNEMQLNALYTLDTNRVVEGQKEVYVANLEGFTDFTKPDLSFYLKINTNNTNAQTYLRLDTTDYLIKCKINDLTKNSIVACRKVGSEIIILNNYMQRQDDAIWGGLDGGGLIEDPSVTKVVGKRYIGADGKAYICLVPSNVNNSENYTPCNVVDNLDKLQNFPITPTNLWRGNVANTTIEIPALKKYSVIFCNIKLHGLTSYVFVKNVTGGGHDDLGDAKNASFTLNFNDSSLTIKTVTSTFVTPTLTEVWGVM